MKKKSDPWLAFAVTFHFTQKMFKLNNSGGESVMCDEKKRELTGHSFAFFIPCIYLAFAFGIKVWSMPSHASPSRMNCETGTHAWSVRSCSFRVVTHSDCNYIENYDRPTMTDAQSAEEYLFTSADM